ncbi:hypothetical protein MAHJHV55_51830 [Mycobacterium avium subsp. hominissuis]
MITLTYIGSAAVVVALALVFLTQAGGVWAFIGVLIVAFFLASAGASATTTTAEPM